ncbi:MAG: amino acid ABC transporter substrate-binding protein [Candidatus Taylorbacteria bacterium]|nr:amino acid ABC transporter substrate-binding protein [Candidatus Taylorbacteria bacterium]
MAMKKNNKYIYLATALLIAVFVYGSLGTKKSDNVDIGVISILSGQFASIGENYVKGVRLAEEVYESNHLGTIVNLHVEDDGFDPKKGISAFKKLTTLNNIDGLVNISSPTIDSVNKDINSLEIPTTQFGIQSDGVADDYIFQISPDPKVPITRFGKYLLENTSFKKVAVVYENGQPFDQFYKAMKESYGTGNTVPMLIQNKSDIQTYATKIALQDFDAVIILAMPESGALLVKKVSELTKNEITYAIDAQFQTGHEIYKQILGNFGVLEGSYSLWLASDDKVNFKERYFEKYKEQPGSFADSGYDAFMVLMNAYNKDKKVWQKNIALTKVSGASGNISFDAKGIRNQDFEVKKIINGEVQVIDHIKMTE